MALKSGEYVARETKKVVVWPKPDHNGDGEVKWVDLKDGFGQSLGQEIEKDAFDREVRYYLPPDGFRNLPGFTAGQDNFVLFDARGQVQRQPNGEAINIKPGQALIFHADGSVETLEDERAQYVFATLHDKAGE